MAGLGTEYIYWLEIDIDFLTAEPLWEEKYTELICKDHISLYIMQIAFGGEATPPNLFKGADVKKNS